jgi:lambda family phage portal protein
MNGLNKVIAVFSPGLALKREAQQHALNVFNKRGYEGATGGRRGAGFKNTMASENTVIAMSVKTLRDRSRELCRNNPYARNAPKRIANNVVGTSIIPTPVHKRNLKSAETQLKRAWKDFGETTACDLSGDHNFYGLQKMVMRAVIKTGVCIVRRIWLSEPKAGVISMRYQLLDPEFLDVSRSSVKAEADGGYTLRGIVFDKNNRKTHYWIYNMHPSENIAQSFKIPANDICYIFDKEDPGQIEGIPAFSSVILRMKDFDEYEDAQLIKQKIAACFAAFVQGQPGSAISVGGTKDDDRLERMEPGIIEYMNEGESVTIANPPSVDGFGEYSRQNLQGQAVGVGMSYEAFTGDLSNVNFSSGRMGWLEFQRNIEDWQWVMLIPQFCEKAYKWFIEAAYLSGLVRDFDFDVSWTAPKREMIDPAKEVKALVEQVRAGFMSWQDAVKSLGYTPDEILAELIKDAKNFDDAGLMPTSDSRYDAERMNAQLKAEKKAEGLKPKA